MTERVTLDTNVLIDLFRRRAEAVEFVRALPPPPVIPSGTVAELFAGVREGRERAEVELFLKRAVTVDIDEQIALQAGLWLRQFRKSHNVGLADALIAATAESEGARVVTLNTKHFPMLPAADVIRPY